MDNDPRSSFALRSKITLPENPDLCFSARKAEKSAIFRVEAIRAACGDIADQG